MKITFYSNFLNHHQIPFCQAMYEKLGDGFTFVATEDVPKEYQNLGYITDFNKYPYLLLAHKDKKNHQKAMTLGFESDVVITGSAPEVYIKKRIKANKLIFRYSERLLKKGFIYALHPMAWLKRYQKDTRYRRKNIYMLSSSAFTPVDYKLFMSYPNKFYKWGYFPEVKTYDLKTLFDQKEHDHVEILWVGRMIDWKRPMHAIKACEKALKDKKRIKLKLIGTGPLEETLKTYVSKNNLSAHITFTGAIPSHEVRSHLEDANILLMTSNKEEGWGAILNEGMNAGCAALAYYEIGSAPYLINQYVNGLLYLNEKDLYDKLSLLIERKQLREVMGKEAYLTMQSLWHPEVAAQRLIDFSFHLLKGEKKPYPQGPLSIAEVIKAKDVYRHIQSVKTF